MNALKGRTNFIYTFLLVPREISSRCDAKNRSCTLEWPLLASSMLYRPSVPRALPGASYFAPSGLLFPHSPNSSFQNYSAPSGLVKIVRSIQGAAPLAIYYAPSGLKSASRRTSSVRSRTSSARSRTSSARNWTSSLYPLSFILVLPFPGTA